MRVAIRRTLRVGDEAGTELEDLGVRPQEEHQLTRADILNKNEDLIAHAAAILAAKTGAKFDVKVQRIGAKLKCELATKGVEYTDIFVARRPRGSWTVSNDALAFEVPEHAEFTLPPGAVEIEFRGYRGSELVCSRRVSA